MKTYGQESERIKKKESKRLLEGKKKWKKKLGNGESNPGLLSESQRC